MSKFVGVKHAGHNKVYWFALPESLQQIAVVGSRVLCDTSRGFTQATIAEETNEDLVHDQEARLAKHIRGDLKQIVAVVIDIPFNRLDVRRYDTAPRNQKIEQRMSEFGKYGCFTTNVQISNGALLDGYSAYVAAKMIGLHSMPVAYCASANRMRQLKSSASPRW